MGWMWAGIDYGEDKAAADAHRAQDAQGNRYTTGGASGSPIYTGGGGGSPAAGGAAAGGAVGAVGAVGGGVSGFNRFSAGLTGAENRIRSLLDNPNSIQQSAAYKFRVGQGQEALQRSLGARGMLNSGNRLTELTKYGQDMASQEYDNQFSRLSDLLKTGASGYASERGANNQAQDISNRFSLGSEANLLNRQKFQSGQQSQQASSGISNPWALPGYNWYNY